MVACDRKKTVVEAHTKGRTASSQGRRRSALRDCQENIGIEQSSRTLPYGASCKDLLKLIGAIKVKGDDPKAIAKIYGKPNIFQARSVLKTLNFSQDGHSFSNLGRDYVYEVNEDEKQKQLLKILMQYSAYEYFLLSIACHNFKSAQDSEKNHLHRETTLLAIEKYWERFQYGSSDYNIHSGAILFAQLVDLSGLGKFVIGRRGEESRIRWSQNAKARLTLTDETSAGFFAKNFAEQARTAKDGASLTCGRQRTAHSPNAFGLAYRLNVERIDVNKVTPVLGDLPRSAVGLQSDRFGHLASSCKPSVLCPTKITIKVDMTNWDVDKITSFFKLNHV